MRRPEINLRHFLLVCTMLCIQLNLTHAQASCGNCVNSDFTVGCNNGINTVNEFGLTCAAQGCLVVPQQDFTAPFTGANSDLPEYCVDFTTPASINDNCDFGLGAFAQLNATGFNPCSRTPSNVLYDAACNPIAPLGPLDLFFMPTWTESQICPNTAYTLCFQYIDVTCVSPSVANGYYPELYYIEAEVPAPAYDVPSAICSGDPVTWTPTAACTGLSADTYTYELYMWTGDCAVPEIALTQCGIDLITDINPNLSLVQDGVTCDAPASSPGVIWDTVCNDPCAPKTVTFFGIVRSANIDCDGDGITEFNLKSGITRYDVLVYPPQPLTQVQTTSTTVCSGTTGVATVALGYDIDGNGTLAGIEICDTKTLSVAANNGCASVSEELTATWTAVDIEGLTGAPAALACYVAAVDGATFTVLPAPPTASLRPVPEVGCAGLANGLVVDLLAGDGITVCTTKMFDIPASAGCDGALLSVNYMCPKAELDELFGAPATLPCYSTISGSTNVTVMPDETSPTITCPGNQTLICGQGLPDAPNELTGSDNCDIRTLYPISVAATELPTSFCDGDNLVVTRTFTAMDVCLNIGTCTQTFTYEVDTTEPVPICPDAVVGLVCGNPLPTAQTMLGGSDNCGMTDFAVISVVDDIVYPQSFCPADGRTVTRTYTVEDGCGNTGTCPQLIVFDADAIGPVLTCPPAITLECSDDIPIIVSSLPGSDNCDVATSFNVTAVDFPSGPLGDKCVENTITRIYTAVDACNNPNFCEQIITILPDTQGPSITCPSDNTSLLCNVDLPEAPDFLTGNDNCDPSPNFAVVGVVVDNTPTSFCVTDNLFINRVFTAVDLCGNTSTCTQVLAYIPDTEPPVFAYIPDPVMTIECFDQVPTKDDIGATDNCSAVEVVCTSVPPNPDFCQTGIFVFTWTATDACNNTTTVQSQIIRNLDNMAPQVVCPQATPIACMGDLPEPITDMTTWMAEGGTATDVCSGGAITITAVDSPDPSTFSYCPADAPFIVTRAYMLTDVCGNTAICDQLISFIPSTPPVATCPTDSPVYSNTPGTCFETVTVEVPAFASDCGVGGVISNNINGQNTLVNHQFAACEDHIVVWTYTDDCGRTASCSQTITVNDDEGPDFLCVPDQSICVDQSGVRTVPISAFYDGNAVDNCAGVMSAEIRRHLDECDNPDNLEFGQEVMFCCADIGTDVLVELVVTDTKGNATSCIVIVDVCHNFSSLACNNKINLSLDENCSGQLTPGMVLANDNYTCSENCEFTITDPWGQVVDNDFDYLDVGHEFQYMICCSGDCCWGTVLVEDKFPPVLACRDTTMTCFDLVSYDGPAIATSCDFAQVELISEDIDKTECSGNGFLKTITREYVAVDKVGNVSETCFNTINITRIERDSIRFPQDTIIQCSNSYDIEDAGVPIYINAMGDTINLYPMPENNCNLWVSLNETPLYVSDCEQKIIRRWTIMEVVCTSENLLAEYVQRIEVVDNQGPHIYCNDAEVLTYTTNGYTCEGNITLPPIDYHDNCSIEGTVDISYPGGIMKNQNGGTVSVPEGLHPVTYNVYDECNNVSTCDIYVNVVDNTPPATLCEHHTVVTLTSGGESLIDSDVFSDGSYDDCGLKKILAKRLSPGCDCYDHHPKFKDMHYIGEWEGHHYYVSHDPIIAPKAQQLSEAMGGYLACIESSYEQNWLEDQLVPLTGSGSYTIGLSDSNHEGVYEWSCGADYDSGFKDWADNQPDNMYTGTGSGSVATTADYVHLNTNGSWYDYDGSTVPLRYIFELEDPCGFTEYVRFCCEDQGSVQQILVRAVDKWGNYNECQVVAEVQNKEAIGCVPLPDITVSCDYNFDDLNVFGKMQTDIDDTREINIDDPNVQYSGQAIDGYIFGGCATEIIEVNPDDNLNQCHRGTMIRQFVIAPGTPNEKSTYQKIHFVSDVDTLVTITWPEDLDTMGCMLDLHPDNLPAKYARPQFEDNGCTLLAAGITSEDIFEFDPVGGESCFKILRQWTVIDWCNVDEFGIPVQWDGPAQILKANNSTPPVISCSPVIANSGGQDCNRIEVVAEVSAFDDCTQASELYWRYHVDLHSDGTIDDLGEGGNVFTGTVPSGEHTLSWWAEDRCGNISERCDQIITTENLQKPSAICIDGISTELIGMDMEGDDGIVDTEMIIVYPEMVNNKSQDACGDLNVTVSFSDDPDDPNYSQIIYGCSDIGPQEVMLWVTASNGVQSFCTTTIDVQDNNDVDICITEEGDRNLAISGTTTTEEGETIPEVEITLMGSNEAPQMTEEDGAYNFGGMPVGGDYEVVPSRNVNHSNGLSTLDLVLIQKHILGIELLDSPYKIIAADVNRSNHVSASDLVELRKMILGVSEEFANNTSWRFVRSDYVFNDPIDPLVETFDEQYDIDNLQTDMNASFIGIKVGDVNNSANPHNVNGNIENRNDRPLKWSIEDESYQKNDIVYVPVRAKDFTDVYGLQLTLDHDGLTFVGVEPGELNMIDDNIGFISQHTSTISWNSDMGLTYDDGQTLFNFIFEVNADETILSNALAINSDITRQEVYVGESYETNDIVIEWENMKDVFTAQLLQNDPNPWKNDTEIQFSIPQDGMVEISVFDLNGQLLYNINKNYSKGGNAIKVSRKEIPVTGVYIYSMQFNNTILQRKMIVMD